METKVWMTIGEFARMSGVSRKNLIYYDSIGLFSPEHIGDNGYRYYGYHQLDTIGVIYALKEIGMPLKEIKIYLRDRSPAVLLSVFERQKEKIDEEIAKLKRISAMIETRLAMTRESAAVDVNKIELRRFPEEQLYLSRRMTAFTDAEINAVLMEYYAGCADLGLGYGSPVGDMVEREKIFAGQWDAPDYYYIRLETGEKKIPGAVVKPAGTYLTGHVRGDYDCVGELYARLWAEIQARGYEVIGNGYRDALLDEIAVKNPAEYLFRVSIRVETDR